VSELSEGGAREDAHGAEVGIIEGVVLIKEGDKAGGEGMRGIREGEGVSEGIIGFDADREAAHAVEGEEARAEVDAAGDEVHAVGEWGALGEAAGGSDVSGEGIIGMCSGEGQEEVGTEGRIVREGVERLLSGREQLRIRVVFMQGFEEGGEERFGAVMFTGFDKPSGDAEEFIEVINWGGECVYPALFELCEGTFVGELHERFLIHGDGECRN